MIWFLESLKCSSQSTTSLIHIFCIKRLLKTVSHCSRRRLLSPIHDIEPRCGTANTEPVHIFPKLPVPGQPQAVEVRGREGLQMSR